MKRLLVFTAFLLSLTVCDVVRSQIKFDSVVINIKNIPSIIEKDIYSPDTNPTHNESYGPGN